MTLPEPMAERRDGDYERRALLRFRAALMEIAAYDDVSANLWLRKHGNYGRFDEPGSVQIAREALEAESRQFTTTTTETGNE